MTALNCINFCSSRGFQYAGTEYSQECCKSTRKVAFLWAWANDFSRKTAEVYWHPPQQTLLNQIALRPARAMPTSLVEEQIA